ncbi:hypothetical protein I8H83_00330 [Candidatus Saccharibacteria bacterium]|nr:hypothetical protein [Candidatus Saccharibacteria bacterium]
MNKQEQVASPEAVLENDNPTSYRLTNVETFHINAPDSDVHQPTNLLTAHEDIFSQLRDVDELGDKIIAVEEGTYVPEAPELSEVTAEEAPRVSRTKRLLGKLATGLSGLKRSVSNVATYAGAKTILAYSGVGSAVQKGFNMYSKPLDKMEANEDDSKSKRAIKFLGRSAYRVAVAGGFAAGMLLTKNVAEAANITVNGHNGGASDAFNNTIAGSNIGAGKENVPVRWSAEMGDLPIFPNEQLSTFESTNEGALRIAEVVAQNPGEKTLLSYSEGTIATAKFLQDNPDFLANGNSAVFVGGPFIPGQELGEHPFMKLIAPLVPETSKVLEYQTPGGENVLHIVREDDFVKLKDNPFGMLAALDPRGHAYSPDDISGNTPHVMIHNADGSSTRIITETSTKLADGSNAKSGISAALVENNNLYVSRKADDFFEELDGDPLSGNVDMQKVVSTGAVAAEEALPGAGAVINNIVNTPGVTEGLQQAADTYMQAQDTMLSGFAEGIQSNPQVAQAVENFTQQAAPMIEQVAPAIQEAVNNFVPPAQQGAVNNFLGQFGVK